MAKRITYSEIFHSIQGEGRYVGVPSIFLRTFGCNFECAGFGQDLDNMLPEEEMPYNTLDISLYDKLEDVPVCEIGCDSSASWAEKYRHLAYQGTPEEVLESINGIKPTSTSHLVLTGGEPLLPGLQMMWGKIFNMQDFRFTNVTIETNGTQLLKNEFIYGDGDRSDTILPHGVFNPHSQLKEIQFSVSPKLSNSGESFSDAIKPAALLSYNEFNRRISHPNIRLNSYLYLKFVIRDPIAQEEELLDAIEAYNQAGVRYDAIYLMPEGATSEQYKNRDTEIARFAMDRGFYYSPRIHCDLFGNGWGT